MIFGYLDPASGSAIIGAIAAGGAGMVVAARAVLAKFGIGRKKKPSRGDTEAASGSDETTL